MDQVTVFQNSAFGEIRAIDQNGEPWFVAKDVAEILGYIKTSDMTRRLKDSERSKIHPQALSAHGSVSRGQSEPYTVKQQKAKRADKRTIGCRTQ